MAITKGQRKTALQKLGARARGTAPARYRRAGARRRSQYADPKRWKYPVDNPDRVRAAISYFGDPKNRQGYAAAEVRQIARRIVAAAVRFKIVVDPGSAVARLAGRGSEGGGNRGGNPRSRRQSPYGRMRGRLKGVRK